MPRYSNVGAFPRIVGLLFLVVLLVAGGALWFDFLGLIDVSTTIAPILNRLGIGGRSEEIVVEEPVLLDAVRVEKERQAIAIREAEIERREDELDQWERELEAQRLELEQAVAALDERENSLNERERRYDDRRANLVAISRDLTSMRPEEAVAILEGYEDQMLIEVLRVTEELAQAAGAMSLVSVWLARMPATRVSEIQRKMALRPDSSL